jgi:hypothetical protein
MLAIGVVLLGLVSVSSPLPYQQNNPAFNFNQTRYTTNDIAAYDAAYVVLAQRLGVPFVTADERLVRKLRHSPYDVRWLGVWP